MSQFRIPKILVFIIVIVLVQLACLGGSGNEPTSPPPPPATDPPPPPPPIATDPPPAATEPPASGGPIDTTAFQSGDQVYYTDFEGSGDWEEGWLHMPIPTVNDGYEVYVDGYSNLYFDVTDANTDVLVLYDPELLFFSRDNADVFVEATVFNVGKNRINNIAVICRYSEEGFYWFSLMSGGKWYMWKYTYGKDWRKLLEGGLQNFDYDSPHSVGASCIGDELTLYIDGVMPKNAQYTESTFRDGGVGLGVGSGNGNVQVEIDNFTVSIP